MGKARCCVALLIAVLSHGAAGASRRIVETPWGAVLAAEEDPPCASDKSCVFTPRTLRRFSGGDKIMYLSVVSYVFNVTSAPEYYASFGSYSYMAGKESSRVLGTMSEVDAKAEIQTLTDLTDSQWAELFDWIEKYNERYPLIGRLTGWDPGVTLDEINERSGFSLRPPPKPSPEDDDPLLVVPDKDEL
eukprot:Hpha_TRINITY_DN2_c0_g1::TRINITY_DN2_c0_g1_i1::g.110148::m.110148/K17278/PGRMC1_2; membrane-associated progesterone receptor component